MEKKVKVANETQRREARKLIDAANVAHKSAINARFHKEGKIPTEADILAVLRSGKIKLMRRGGYCSCISIHTNIGNVIDFGQEREEEDSKGRTAAHQALDAAKNAIVARVSLGTLTAEEVLSDIEAFTATKF